MSSKQLCRAQRELSVEDAVDLGAAGRDGTGTLDPVVLTPNASRLSRGDLSRTEREPECPAARGSSRMSGRSGTQTQRHDPGSETLGGGSEGGCGLGGGSVESCPGDAKSRALLTYLDTWEARQGFPPLRPRFLGRDLERSFLPLIQSR